MAWVTLNGMGLRDRYRQLPPWERVLLPVLLVALIVGVVLAFIDSDIPGLPTWLGLVGVVFFFTVLYNATHERRSGDD